MNSLFMYVWPPEQSIWFSSIRLFFWWNIKNSYDEISDFIIHSTHITINIYKRNSIACEIFTRTNVWMLSIFIFQIHFENTNQNFRRKLIRLIIKSISHWFKALWIVNSYHHGNQKWRFFGIKSAKEKLISIPSKTTLLRNNSNIMACNCHWAMGIGGCEFNGEQHR